MGLLDRFEKGIERAVNGAFARVFRAEVQPVEIASALRRACDDRAAVVGRGRTLVPNAFVVELGPADYERLSLFADALGDELADNLREHATEQRYAFVGPVSVELEQADDLETGVFRVRTATLKARRSGSSPAPAPNQAAREAPYRPAPYPPVAQPPASEPPDAYPADDYLPDGYPADDYPAPAYLPDPAAQPSVGQAPAPAAPPVHRPAPSPITASTPARRPWLDIDGHAYPLVGSVTVVGRGDEADIVVDDPGVSRRHAEIRVTADGPHLQATLRDLGSTNGTLVAGRKVQSEHLGDGTTITVGRTHATYRSGER